MKRKNLLIHCSFALLTLAALLWVAVPAASAQSQTMTPQSGDRDREDITQRELANFDQFFDSHPELSEQLRKDPSLINNQEFVQNHADLQEYLQKHPEAREEFSQNPNRFMHQEQRYDRREDDRDRDGDTTRRELVNMDRFLDSHPEIAEQLRKDPSLVNNKDFMEHHPALQQFLAEHPGVREEYKENPNAFMHQENRFDRREDFRDRDITHAELVNMDRFLDSHPEIAEQLRKDPSLVNNKEFVDHHAALQQFLAEHPGVREEYKENPNAFMHQENRYDRREDSGRYGDRDINRRELANMDRFLDSHPEIAEQLHKDPSLVNNKDFMEHHPALQQFLAEHQGVREEYKENPNAFMHQENRFDRREDSGMMRRDRDVTSGELSSFNEFLEGHSSISNELSKNPALAKSGEFQANHPALQDYLKTHPEVKEELNENPQSFLKSAQQFNSTHKTAKVAGDPKTK